MLEHDAGAGSDGEGEEDGSLPASPRRKSKHVQVCRANLFSTLSHDHTGIDQFELPPSKISYARCRYGPGAKTAQCRDQGVGLWIHVGWKLTVELTLECGHQVFKPDRGNARAKGGLLWRVQPQHGDIVVKQGPAHPQSGRLVTFSRQKLTDL